MSYLYDQDLNGVLKRKNIYAVDLELTGDLTVEGSFTFGDAAADTLTVNGVINQTVTLATEDYAFDQTVTMSDTTGVTVGIVCQPKVTATGGEYYGIVVSQHVDSTQALTGGFLITNDSGDTMTHGIKLTPDGTMTTGLEFSGTFGEVIVIGNSSGSPVTVSSPNTKCVKMYIKTTATSGDNRALYIRYEQNGAGGGGEAIRAFSKVTAALGTARGAHISIDMDAAGTVSGFGAGIDAQVLYGDTAYTSQLTALNLELYAGGSSTSISAGSGSFIRCVLGGDATGIADLDDNAGLILFTGGSIASGNIVQAETDETKFSHKIRCKFNGTTLYLMACET